VDEATNPEVIATFKIRSHSHYVSTPAK